MTTPATSHHHGHAPANRRRRVLKTAAPLLVRYPAADVRAAVVVLHDERGLTAEAEDACRALAECGYLAVAPLLYYDTGGRVFPRGNFAALEPDDLAADVAGALDHLSRRAGVPASAFIGLGQGAHLARARGPGRTSPSCRCSPRTWAGPGCPCVTKPTPGTKQCDSSIQPAHYCPTRRPNEHRRHTRNDAG